MIRLRRMLANVGAVAYREATVLRHDRGFLSTVLAQPIVMLLLFGLGLSNTPANVPWAVVDRSQSGPSRRLVEEIRTTGYFLAPTPVDGYERARAMLERGDLVAVVVIPRDFRRALLRGDAAVQVLLDGSDPLSSARVGAYVAQAVQAFAPARDAPVRAREPEPRPPAGPIDVRQRFRYNPTLADRDFFLATLAGVLLTNLCLSVTALGIVGERESGTFEQVLSLPTTPLEIVLGKLVPLVVVSYVLLAIAILGAGLAFGIWPRGSLVALGIVTLPFVLASLAIGVFVSAFARSSVQAVFLTVFFILPSFVLSGVMFSYELMPPAIRVAGTVLPLRWYQIALRRIFARGGDLGDVVVPMLAMLAIFAVLLAAIRWRLKPRLA
ncbi:MAG: ABC transporter permease [bacterium]|nr:ABC transporter permease [bacterium]